MLEHHYLFSLVHHLSKFMDYTILGNILFSDTIYNNSSVLLQYSIVLFNNISSKLVIELYHKNKEKDIKTRYAFQTSLPSYFIKNLYFLFFIATGKNDLLQLYKTRLRYTFLNNVYMDTYYLYKYKNKMIPSSDDRLFINELVVEF